jgi:integrase
MRDTVSKFRAQYGEMPIDKISAGDVKEWLSRLPLAVKTRNKHLGYVASMFRLAFREWNLIEKNPLAEVKKFSDPHNGHKVSIFTPEELQIVLSSVTPDWLPVFSINVFTGLRRAEVERLDWSEIKLNRRLIDLPYTKSKNGRRKLIQIPENLATILSPLAKTEGPLTPNRRFDLEVKRLKTLGIKWPNNVLRHSFCSYAVAVHGFVWTAEQADHFEVMLKKHYREVVTKEDAEKFWNIRPLVNTPTKGTKNFGVSKPIKSKKAETTSSIAKSSTPVKKVESAKSTPEENFTKIIELHKAKGPVPFRPTQRDYKRQEKLMSVDSPSKITNDGLFKDEADLNGFRRWILRCQAKREAGTFEP